MPRVCLTFRSHFLCFGRKGNIRKVLLCLGCVYANLGVKYMLLLSSASGKTFSRVDNKHYKLLPLVVHSLCTSQINAVSLVLNYNRKSHELGATGADNAHPPGG